MFQVVHTPPTPGAGPHLFRRGSDEVVAPAERSAAPISWICGQDKRAESPFIPRDNLSRYEAVADSDGGSGKTRRYAFCSCYVRHVETVEEQERHMSIKKIFQKLMKDNLGSLGAIVSWSILTSVVPIIVGLIAISGFVLRNNPSA